MSIYDSEEKINPGTEIPFDDNNLSDPRAAHDKIKPFYTLILIIVIASIFFALGRLSSLEKQKESIKIINPVTLQTGSAILAVPETTTTQIKAVQAKKQPVQVGTTTPAGGEVIGVKTSKKYYFPWCGVMKRVKPENKVPFATYEAARAAGYVPGGGCKGLK